MINKNKIDFNLSIGLMVVVTCFNSLPLMGDELQYSRKCRSIAESFLIKGSMSNNSQQRVWNFKSLLSRKNLNKNCLNEILNQAVQETTQRWIVLAKKWKCTDFSLKIPDEKPKACTQEHFEKIKSGIALLELARSCSNSLRGEFSQADGSGCNTLSMTSPAGGASAGIHGAVIETVAALQTTEAPPLLSPSYQGLLDDQGRPLKDSKGNFVTLKLPDGKLFRITAWEGPENNPKRYTVQVNNSMGEWIGALDYTPRELVVFNDFLKNYTGESSQGLLLSDQTPSLLPVKTPTGYILSVSTGKYNGKTLYSISYKTPSGQSTSWDVDLNSLISYNDFLKSYNGNSEQGLLTSKNELMFLPVKDSKGKEIKITGKGKQNVSLRVDSKSYNLTWDQLLDFNQRLKDHQTAEQALQELSVGAQ